MSLRVYRKAPVQHVVRQERPVHQHKASHHRITKFLPPIMVTLGSMLIANVLWPIVSYQLFVSPTLQTQTFVSPVMQQEQVQQLPPIAPAKAAETVSSEPTPPPPVVVDGELDFTNLSSWFSSQPIPEVSPEQAKTYTISIPSLDIEHAVVQIGGTDLDKSVIQYPGTANPGELGSPILFGHSVSPLFYNPSISNPKRYVSIFTKIMSLKKDDKVIVNYDNVQYTYRVTNKVEVKPDDTYILEQRYDARELKLVTCTPPGTKAFRGIVFAQLEDIE